MQFQRFALPLVLLAAAPLVHAADFINGSFEDPNIGPATVRLTNSAELTGWTVNQSSVIISNGYDGSGSGTTWHDTASGSQYLYVNTNAGDESISQSVVVDAGANALSFLLADYASDYSVPGGAILVSIVRDSDSLAIVSSQGFTTPDYSDFLRKSLTFTAPTSEAYTFTFQGVAGHAGNIDDVTLRAVPEPTTVAGLGLGALGLMRRRRRA